jgi:hypothetical protein
MEFSQPPLVVAFELSETRKAIVADALAGASDVVYLTELDEAARAEALRNAGVLLTFNTSKKLRSGEVALLAGARLIQFMIGGVDFIPLGELPKGRRARGSVTDKLAVTVTWAPERGGYVGTASDLPGGGPVGAHALVDARRIEALLMPEEPIVLLQLDSARAPVRGPSIDVRYPDSTRDFLDEGCQSF